MNQLQIIGGTAVKKAKFITNPNYKTMEAEHPWHKKERVYNSRALNLEPSCAIENYKQILISMPDYRDVPARIQAIEAASVSAN